MAVGVDSVAHRQQLVWETLLSYKNDFSKCMNSTCSMQCSTGYV